MTTRREFLRTAAALPFTGHLPRRDSAAAATTGAIRYFGKTPEYWAARLTDKSSETREFARQALIDIGRPVLGAAVRFMEASANAEDAQALREAVRVVVAMNGNVGDRVIQRILRGRSSTSKPQTATKIALLEQFRYRRLRRRVLGWLLDSLQDGDAGVRQAAVETLGWHIDDRAHKPEIASALTSALYDPDARVRRNAVDALARGGSDVSGWATKAYRHDDLFLRAVAAGYYAGTGRVDVSPDPARILLDSLYSRDAQIVHAAARGIRDSAVDLSSAAPRLLRLIRHDDSSVREMAALALGKRGVSGALAPLLDRFPEEPDGDARLGVARAIGLLGGGLSLESLQRWRRREDPEVRADAYLAIRLVPLPCEAEHLLPMAADDFEHDCPRVRSQAARAAGSIGRSAVALLTHLFKSRSTRVRAAAALGLGEAGQDAYPSLPQLRRLLHDPSPEVAERALDSLLSIRRQDPAALPALRRRVLQGSLWRRFFAAADLAENGPRGRNCVLEFVGHSDPVVRAAALFGLLPVGPLDGGTYKILSAARRACADDDLAVRIRAKRVVSHIQQVSKRHSVQGV